MSEFGASRGVGRASEMMWKFWYPAQRSEQVRRNKLVRAMLLDVPLVLGRDTTGKPFALRDVCPTGRFRSRLDNLMAQMWSARITAGNLTRILGSAT